MVSRILISIALLCSSVAFSQDENGLMFSQVLIVDISNEVVVPEGKVWKVVSILRSNGSYTQNSQLLINGIITYLSDGIAYEAAYALPLWLPSGTSVQAPSYLKWLNIIEFNTD